MNDAQHQTATPSIDTLLAQMPQIEISLYGSVKDSKGKASKLSSVLRCIYSGDSPDGTAGALRANIDRLRTMTKGSPEHLTMKKALPAFTAQGLFTTRAKDKIKKPSDVVVVDIDDLSSMDAAAALRDGFRDDPHVYAAFISPSGNGVKLLIRTKGLIDDAAFKRLFPLLQRRYGDASSVDTSGKDISRLCILSYDPDMWINPACTPLPVPDEIERPAQPSVQRDTGLTLIRTAASDDVVHDIAQHGINMLQKAERAKELDAGASRHEAMIKMQCVIKSRIQAEGVADESAIYDALLTEWADMHHGDAERISDFKRAWADAPTFPYESDPSNVQHAANLNGQGSADKAAQPSVQRDRMGRIVTPAERVLFGQAMNDEQYETMLAAASIDPSMQYERPPVLFRFDGHPLLTLQNISVISGKAKSRKSGFASVLAAMVISPNSNRMDWQRMRRDLFQAERPHDRSGVLLFDTEQATYHAWNITRRILYMADREQMGSRALRAYALRDFNPSDRLQFIAATIERHAHECSLVIIDGIRDVVMNINSEDEATLMNSWLLNVTKRHNIHITCVIHENKGSDTLRGHIGTELMNKAEAVFTVTKGSTKATKELSSVETSLSRNKGMDRVGIEFMPVDRDNGDSLLIPVMYDDGRADRIGHAAEGTEQVDRTISEDQHKGIMRAIWADDPAAELTSAELRDAIRAHAAVMLDRPSISEREGRDILAHWHAVKKWISDNGKATKGRAYRLQQPDVISDAGKAGDRLPQNNIRMDFAGADDVPF